MYSKKINAQEIEKAKEKFSEIVKETPLQYSARLSKKYGCSFFLKREDLQVIRSYKIRGAFNAISNLEEKNRVKGVVCASAGNHAQGVAVACKFFKATGFIFMPKTTPLQKIERTKKFGGRYVQVILEGDSFDDAQKKALEFSSRKKISYIAPFDNENTIIGNGTIGLEILKQMGDKKIDAVVVPIGGGGLISGIGSYIKEKSPNTKIIGVEANGSASMKEAFKKGRPVELKKVETFADGVAVKKIGDINFKIAKKVVDELMTVPENRVCATILKLLKEEGIILEPAGALSINAVRDFSKKELKNKNIVCILSGGNLDFNRLPNIKERYLSYKGLKKYLIVNFPQRPKALREFVDCLGDEDNVVDIYYSEAEGQWGEARINIQTTKKKNFEKLYKKLNKANIKFRENGGF